MHFTKIPTLFLPLPDYSFYDSPYPAGPESKVDRKFISRSEIEQKIRSRVFENTSSNAGSVIVTGFRGSGKSSVVRKVIREERKKKGKRIWFAELNLAQDEINERNILKLIALELQRKLNSSKTYRRSRTFMLFGQLCLFPALPLFLLFTFNLNGDTQGSPLLSSFYITLNHLLKTNSYLFFAIHFLFFASFALALPDIWSFIQEKVDPRYSRTSRVLVDRIESLLTRIDSSVTEETQRGISSIQAFNPFNLFKRRQVNYRNVTTKEIELEIVDVLNRINSWPSSRKPKIVFLIDELDKLIPHGNSKMTERDREDPTDDDILSLDSRGTRGTSNDLVRQRQDMVAGLFANLKHFLNVAQAKFIFIGGRELFDAILADTSNRDPFLGSIFYDTIYVPSFLKEEMQTGDYSVSGITTATEHFIAKSLLSDEYIERRGIHSRKNSLLSTTDIIDYYRENTDASEKEILYIFNAINEFICFLTFRSNGIAKKMVHLFESYITTRVEDSDPNISTSIVIRSREQKQVKLFLRFSSKNLYSHHLINGFYKPFIGKHSRSYRALNDAQLVSFTYVLDHLIKFHALSFSSRYLELTPEIISLNKVPEFRKFLNYLMDVLSINHIRSLNNGLFNYQFYRKTSMEISYLSKISEYDSAALNFTLDESLPLKQHYYKRLKHYTQQYAKLREGSGKGHLVDSLGQMMLPINEWLGDLHFFDGEFDEASAQYRSGASSAWDNMFSVLGTEPRKDFAPVQNLLYEYTKLHLKRILCLDKMRAHEDALALNADLLNDIFTVIKNYGPFTLLDNWRIYVLAIGNYLVMLEKSSYGGVRKVDLDYTDQLIEKLLNTKNLNFTRLVRNIRFTYYDYVGQILFYKNRGGEDLDAISYYTNQMFNFLQVNNSNYEKLFNWEDGSGLKKANVAGHFTRLGDAYLSYKPDKKTVPQPNLGLLKYDFENLELMELWKLIRRDIDQIKDSTYITAMSYYSKSYELYKKSGIPFRAVFQLKKILFTILSKRYTIDKAILDGLIELAIKDINNYQSSHHLPQQRKLEYQFGNAVSLDDKMVNNPFISEILEFECLRQEILLRAKGSVYIVPDKFWSQYAIRPVTQFARLQLFRLKLEDNLRRLGLQNLRGDLMAISNCKEESDKFNKIDGSLIEAREILITYQSESVKLIADSIYCSSEAIRLIELYGTSLVSVNSMLATMHSKLGLWSLFYHLLPSSKKSDCRHQISLLLDRKVLSRLDPNFHFSSAISYYERCEQQHSMGKYYTRFLEDMFFLEEDFSDSLVHFNTALERAFLNSWSDDNNPKKNLQALIDILSTPQFERMFTGQFIAVE
jgi:Cdc6-like AAA superfamily ATPase